MGSGENRERDPDKRRSDADQVALLLSRSRLRRNVALAHERPCRSASAHSLITLAMTVLPIGVAPAKITNEQKLVRRKKRGFISSPAVVGALSVPGHHSADALPQEALTRSPVGAGSNWAAIEAAGPLAVFRDYEQLELVGCMTANRSACQPENPDRDIEGGMVDTRR